jgi:8-oxo-dGTP pyrophosphatase MutT (NUDIX family)
MLEKVTAFVIRRGPAGMELLLLEHPHAGIQFPAGTVEPGETPEQAARREAVEETGLADLRLLRLCGARQEQAPPGYAYLLRRCTVYSRPDPASFDWAVLPRSAFVQVLREQAGYAQVRYEEDDRTPDPQYASMIIQGWLPAGALTTIQRRTFFLLECAAPTPARWEVAIDNHVYRLFWSPLEALPPALHHQQAWMEIFTGLPPQALR